jgi:hypothetical protein
MAVVPLVTDTRSRYGNLRPQGNGRSDGMNDKADPQKMLAEAEAMLAMARALSETMVIAVEAIFQSALPQDEKLKRSEAAKNALHQMYSALGTYVGKVEKEGVGDG